MRPKVEPLAKGYIEHQGIKYAHFDDRETEYEYEHYPEQVIGPLLGWPTDDWIFMKERDELVGSTTTLTNVHWRSDQGWTAPHDVTITGEYTMHIPQEAE